MATTSWFLPTSVSVENNIVNTPDTTWSNINYLTTLTGTHTQTTSMLCYNANTNYIIATGFNAEIPFGTQFVGAEFEIRIGLNSVSDTNNVKSNITIARYNGSDFETNFPMLDWGYDNTNTLYYAEATTDITQAIAESASFGVKFDAMNDFQTDCYTAYIDSIKLRLHYNVVNPRLYYNGDSTSEVFVTLDLNPAVTSPTTTFQILDGYDLETYGYTCGAYYTAPISPDPSGDGFLDTFSNISTGTYTSNYLSTPVYTHAGTSGSYILSNHVMSYNKTNLIAGNTYRRGLILLDIIDKSGDTIIDAEIYDTLFFNIEVIDTTPVIHPYLIYNGDTSSEVFITIDKNISDTTSFEFGVFHGDVTAVGYQFGSYYTPPNINDPVDTFTEVSYNTYGEGFYTSNYLSSVDQVIFGAPSTYIKNGTSLTTPTLYSTTNHTLNINATSLVAGNTYRRGFILNNMTDSGLIYFVFGDPYDVLWVNIEVIDTSAVPRRRNTGTFGNFMI